MGEIASSPGQGSVDGPDGTGPEAPGEPAQPAPAPDAPAAQDDAAETPEVADEQPAEPAAEQPEPDVDAHPGPSAPTGPTAEQDGAGPAGPPVDQDGHDDAGSAEPPVDEDGHDDDGSAEPSAPADTAVDQDDDAPAEPPTPVDASPAGPTAEELAAAEAQRAAAEQAAADLAAVKQWAAQRAEAERAAADAAALAAAAQVAADEAELERVRAEQAAADLAAVREWAAQRAAAEQAADEQAAADRAAVEQEQAARAAAEQQAAEQAQEARWAAERAEADRIAAERAAAEQAEADRAAAAAEMAAERAAIQQQAAERAAADQAAQRAAAEKAAAEHADVERAQAEWAAGRHAAAAQAAEAAQRTPAPRGATAAPATGRRRAAGPAARRSGRRTKVLVAALVAAVLVVAGVVGTLWLTGGNSSVVDDAEQVPDAVLPELSDPSPVLTELSADAPVPDATALSAVLTPLLAAPALGTGLSAQVVDVATGTVLFDRDADDPSTPASTAKLLTGLAALTTLDPTDTLATTVVAGSAPGEVVLVGGGDPTLSTTSPSVDYPGAATVADLAGQVQQALGGQPVTRVVVDNSLFTGPLTAPGWGPDDAPSTYAAPVVATAVDGARVEPGETPRSGSPGTDAGQALAAALGAPDATVDLGVAPAGARTLGTVHSAPIARLVEEALTASDNLLAESLARQVAIARGLPASFAGVADAVPAAVADAGLDTTGLTLVDGSGLSEDDRVPASLLVDVVQAAADGSIADADGLLSGLPVAGYDGTLAERAVAEGDAAPGSVRAKTGTLLGVNDLAGTVVTADGRLLAFAVLADGATGSVDTTEAALDVVADALAGCGCR